ncbi:MAG: hypothetical protein ACYC7L_13125 [Nitrospirota bacterium]
MVKKLTRFLASVELAITLLVVILVSCFAGVTVFRGERAWDVIFDTLWFNSLLVFLVVNIAFCFFPRIWGRKPSIIMIGMVLFHVSFVSMLGGIVYNSLFYFRGSIRITEGEVLPSGASDSYDRIDKGRFFDMANLKGDTALTRMHRDYEVNGVNKRAAYEIAVGEGSSRKQGIIYVTKKLVNDGFQYFTDQEGYSILITFLDLSGKPFYGAHVPLQSLKIKENEYLYTTGTKYKAGSIPLPESPFSPLFGLQASFHPSMVKGTERQGEVTFLAWPLKNSDADAETGEKPFAEGTVPIGGKVRIKNCDLSPTEIRYWVIMNVRYEPGKPIVLTSLWVGLSGMLITFIGRVKRGS